jgi:hypothetical protein
MGNMWQDVVVACLPSVVEIATYLAIADVRV